MILRSSNRPTRQPKLPVLAFARRAAPHALLLCLFTLLLLCCLPSSTAAQDIVVPFLSDAPRHVVTLHSDSLSVALSVRYASSLTVVTSNASALYAIVDGAPSVRYTEAPTARTSDGARALLLGSTHAHPSFQQQCASLDTAQSGLCNLTMVLSGAQADTVFYSLTPATQLTYNTPYSATATPGSLLYYSRYVNSGDLNVLFDLGSAGNQQLPLYTVMLLTSEVDPFTPLYSSLTTNYSALNPSSDEQYLLTANVEGQFNAGVYLVGLWCYNFSSPASSTLLLTPGVQYNSGGSTNSDTTGYATVLSVMALILAAAIAAMLLIRVCIVVRRRRTELIIMSRAEVAILESVRAGQAMPPPAVVAVPARQLGATEEELASLPEMVYLKSVPVEGDEADNPRCSICLEDYVSELSRITTLRCGHSFHSACAHVWLRQRRYCPLCLQIIDRAHDVKKERAAPSATPHPHVELADVSRAGLPSRLTSSSAASSSVSGVTYSFSRPTRGSDATRTGPAFPNWDDEEVPSRSVALSDGRTSSRLSVYSPSGL